MASDEIMTLREVAAYLQLGTGKVYRLAQVGELPAAKIGRIWRFRKDLVDAWFLDHMDPQRKQPRGSPSRSGGSPSKGS